MSSRSSTFTQTMMMMMTSCELMLPHRFVHFHFWVGTIFDLIVSMSLILFKGQGSLKDCFHMLPLNVLCFDEFIILTPM
jgi:hypothetical protein